MSLGARRARRERSPTAKVLLWVLGAAALLYVVLHLSPWPTVLVYRHLLHERAAAEAASLAKHVPSGVMSKLDERYDPNNRHALLDVHYPSAIEGGGTALTTIVWIHGGGWIAGSKREIANYAKILSSNGYTVVGVNYSLAPGARYPAPLKDINAALAFLVKNAERLHVDPSRFVLAGNSAGAQMAAQMANIISVPAYAAAVGIAPAITRKQLAGTILYCGLYDAGLFHLRGGFAGFLLAAAWSYFGERNFLALPQAAEFSVPRHVTADFPPTFISVGNDDPVLPHSLAMADALAAKGAPVDRLFFPADHKPPVGHEYQFDLDSDGGKLALSRMLKFLTDLPR